MLLRFGKSGCLVVDLSLKIIHCETNFGRTRPIALHNRNEFGYSVYS